MIDRVDRHVAGRRAAHRAVSELQFLAGDGVPDSRDSSAEPRLSSRPLTLPSRRRRAPHPCGLKSRPDAAAPPSDGVPLRRARHRRRDHRRRVPALRARDRRRRPPRRRFDPLGVAAVFAFGVSAISASSRP